MSRPPAHGRCSFLQFASALDFWKQLELVTGMAAKAQEGQQQVRPALMRTRAGAIRPEAQYDALLGDDGGDDKEARCVARRGISLRPMISL
jgi:hypothetical protein